MIRCRLPLLASLALSLLVTAPGWADSRADQLLDKVHRVVEPLVQELKQNPRDARLQARIGSYYAKARLWPEARAYFHAAVQLEPDDADYRAMLGRILWSQGEQDRAVEEWVRSLESDPEGRAKKYLEEFSPGHLEPPRVVSDTDTFLEVARYQQDFRRQKEVQKALSTFNIKKATHIILAPVNTVTILEDLHTHGYLDRAGGPPSGVGQYLYDEAGKIYSTEYGSQALPRGGPAALRSPRGYKASPEAVLKAMETGRPEAFEFGFAQLSNQDIERGMARIARGAAGLRDPWALDALLGMLVLRARAVDDPVPAPLRGFLEALLVEAKVEPFHRWLVMALLYQGGRRDFDPLPEDELDELLAAGYRREVPKEAALAGLDALGGAAEAYLVRLLEPNRTDAKALGGAFMAMPRYGKGPGFQALIQVLERDGWKWNYWKPMAQRALKVMAGKDLGTEPGPWRAVASELFEN